MAKKKKTRSPSVPVIENIEPEKKSKKKKVKLPTASKKTTGGKKTTIINTDNFYEFKWNDQPRVRDTFLRFYVTQEQLKKYLDCDDNLIEKMVEDGLPVYNRDGEPVFHFKNVCNQLVVREQKFAEDRFKDKHDIPKNKILTNSTTEVEARRINEVKKAQVAELEFDLLTGGKYDADEVVREVRSAVSDVVAKVIQMENLAASLEGLTAHEMRPILKNSINAALNSLADYLED